MSEKPTLEDRVATLEHEFAELKKRLQPDEPKEDWITKITGSMADYPEFQEVLRLGQEIRRADRPADAPGE